MHASPGHYRVVGELRFIEEASEARTKFFVVSLGFRHAVLQFGPQSGLFTLFEFSQESILFFFNLQSLSYRDIILCNCFKQKQAKEEEERLTTELQLITQERKSREIK